MNKLNNTIPRMETIQATAELLNLPIHFVRQRVLSGEFVATRAGYRKRSKYLVNVDKAIEYLNTHTITEAEGAEDVETAPCK